MRGITKKALSFVLSGACLLTVPAYTSYNSLPMTAVAMDYDEKGSVNGYDYEIWLQNEFGDITYENTENNGFTFLWDDNIENTVCMKGKVFEESVKASDFPDFYVSYDADVYFNYNSFLSVYGWMKDSRTEFRIIDAWGSWRPSGNYNYIAKTVIDGCTYELYDIIHDQYGCFDGSYGNEYHEIISLRTSSQTVCNKGMHLNNTININEHFKAWEEAGFELGIVDRIMLSVDGYRSGGNLSVNYLYMGEELPEIDPSQIKQHIEYLNEKAEFSYDRYSLDSGDIKDGLLDGETAFVSNQVVIRYVDELEDYISGFLNEKAAKDFAADYDEDFFDENVLLLNTFHDSYNGHITDYKLNKLYYSDGRLNVLFTSFIGVYSQPNGLDILKIELSRRDYVGKDIVWERAEELEPHIKRVTVIDEATEELVDISDNTQFSELFSDYLEEPFEYCEGNNPYYLYYALSYSPELSLNPGYLPDGYVLALDNPRDCRHYPNGSEDIIFRVNKITNGDINEDGVCNIADIVVFQKWLLSSKNAYLMNWKAADLYTDNKLDIFDLCLMRKKLLELDNDLEINDDNKIGFTE
ncbi:glycoside hydrolase family 11 protein [Ruminococcus sp.]|uniref:glycoside hydrolase family 11 protein n=1 Tax=Ruminococcus sp. TaxID=41978 RepID=UPI0025D4C053|nr:glycoside hydrolase family 11 protein [Ruminococcus sp.]